VGCFPSPVCACVGRGHCGGGGQKGSSGCCRWEGVTSGNHHSADTIPLCPSYISPSERGGESTVRVVSGHSKAPGCCLLAGWLPPPCPAHHPLCALCVCLTGHSSPADAAGARWEEDGEVIRACNTSSGRQGRMEVGWTGSVGVGRGKRSTSKHNRVDRRGKAHLPPSPVPTPLTIVSGMGRQE